MSRDYYISGQWNLTCDVCGKIIKSGEAKKRWDGMIVCPQDYEQRHPSDFLRVRKENTTLPFSRPEPEDTFVSVSYIDTGDTPYCTPLTSQGEADAGTADCARADVSTFIGEL